MIAAALIGALAGTGLLVGVWAFVPPRRDLAAAIGAFDRERAESRTVTFDPHKTSLTDRLGHWLGRHLSSSGLLRPTLRANLALLDRSLESHLVAKLTTALIGFLLPSVVWATMAAADVAVPVAIPLLLAVGLAVGFSFLPDLSVAQEADKRRTELRRALACYLDLVSMALAGGRGVPEALPAATRIGRGWAFGLIAETLSHARYSGTTPWDALRDLGERTAVNELRDLGAALGLVADDGAKVKESLRARAATARARQLAEAEGDAEKASESIKNAHLFLGFAFLLFLAYPAVAAVMAI